MGKRDTDAKFSHLLRRYEGAGRAPHYLAFFDCFNRQLYFDAHEVLEALWLNAPGPNHGFYKGLLQIAGAFVHVQKRRKGPALALLRLARKNLERYNAVHEGLGVGDVLGLIGAWEARIRECPIGREAELLRVPPALAVPVSP
jgi:predicted metal-dependent hydrolase